MMADPEDKKKDKSRHKSKDRDKSTDKVKKDRDKSTDKAKSKERSKEKPAKESDSPGSNKENKTHKSKSGDKDAKDKEKRHKSRDKDAEKDSDRKKEKSEKSRSKSKDKSDEKSKHKEKKTKEAEVISNGITNGQANLVPAKPAEKPKPEPNVEYGYEDDFEEYDDDFEDDDDEDNEIAKATAAPPPSRLQQQDIENEEEARDTVDSTIKNKSTKRKQDSADSRRKSIQSRIDFSHASAPEISFGALGQAQKRHLRLLNLIDLDGMTYDILEMPPVKDYEFYIQNFGKGNRIQVQTQTGDEDGEREIQTDEVDNEEKWTQHPPTDAFGSGGDTATKTYEDADEDEFRQFRTGALYTTHFIKFVSAGGQLLSDLLAEGHLAIDNGTLEHQTAEPFSSGFNAFSLGALSKDSQVTAVTFCSQQPKYIATAFYVNESIADDITKKALVVQWLIDETEVPNKILLCENLVHSCCYSPNGDVIFAGLDDGSVVAWDLNEPDSLHHVTIPWRDYGDLVLRTATYDTAYLNGVKQTSKGEAYSSPIRTVACIGDATSDKPISSYQLACLEECGTVHIWTVLESLSAATELTSELDLGLSPGGKLKLLKSAEIKPAAAFRREGSLSLCAHGMVRDPSDHSQFYIGTDYGFILHVTRARGGFTGPRGYESDFDVPSDVLSQAFSPFEPTILIAGSSDGAIRLYKVSQSAPIATFRLGHADDDAKQRGRRATAVTHLEWSWTNPYVFYSVHGNSEFAVWDMKKSRTNPKSVSNSKDKTVLSTTSWGVPSTEDGCMKNSFMAFGFADGSIQVHLLKEDENKEKDYSLKTDGHRILKILGST